ncbi:MAG: L,D-transpeptidase [Erythrobacter sp.]|nr:L,D-transpeptidase [Erythrobacter sp.]
MTFGTIRAIGLCTGAALAVLASTAMAQTAGPQDLLPPQAARSADTPAPNAFDQAFPRMISQPVIQGEEQKEEKPLVLPWSLANARALLAAIGSIGTEGLDPADYQPDLLREAVAQGPSENLDVLASRSFAWLVEDLRDGRTPMEARKQWFVQDPDHLRFPTADLLAGALASGDIAGTLAQLDPTHPDYARLREELALTAPEDTERRKLIRANMDRWRWLARDLGKQYLITNVPEYQLRLTVNDRIIATYRTIVGKPGRTATPQLAELVEGVIFNPTWTVPQSIVVGEGLGQKVLNNPSWARQAGYKAVKGENGWIGVVQQPGPGNSLGLVKLDMPNRHAIFLHDTPARNLFNSDVRAFSHGCIRVERALELAMTIAILGKGADKEQAVTISNSREYTRVPITRRLPVYITYFTMASDIDGKLATFGDVYDRDSPVLASLDQPRVANRSRVTDEEVIEIVDDPRA